MSNDAFHEVSGVYPDLALHAMGEWVTYAQNKLIEAGLLDAHQADGMFGERTEEALRHFQSMHGLAADGIVGQYTWAALDSVGAQPAADAGHATEHGADAAAHGTGTTAGAAPAGRSADATAHSRDAAHSEPGVLRFRSLPTIAASDGALVWTVYNAGHGVVPEGTEGGHWSCWVDQRSIPGARDVVRTERDLHPDEQHEEFGIGLKFNTPRDGDYQAGVTLGDETHYVAYRVANGQVHLLG